MNPKPRPPLPGGEHVQLIDTGPQGVSPGATRVNLIPVGDGGPAPLLPRPPRKPRPAAWLELVVSFDAGTPVADVMRHTLALVKAVADAVPDLGLTYDFERTRAEGESVILALRPRNPAGAAARLREVADVVEAAMRVPVAEPSSLIRRAVEPMAAKVGARVAGDKA